MIDGTDDLRRNLVSKLAADQYVGQYQGRVQEIWDNAVRLVEKNFAAPAAAQTPDEQQKQQDLSVATSKKRAGSAKGNATKERRIAQGEQTKAAPDAERPAATSSSSTVQAVGTRPKSKAQKAPENSAEVIAHASDEKR